MKDENEFLDPETNPMIPVYGEPVDLDKVEIFDGSGLAPFEIVPKSTPEAISEKLAAAFPGHNEIKIDESLTVQRMASGIFMNASQHGPAELSPSDLAKVAAFLAMGGR